MYRLKVWLRHYFGFTTRESRGFLVLLGVLAVVLAAPSIFTFFLPNEKSIEGFIQEIKADSALATLEVAPTYKAKEVRLFPFDPNSVNQGDMETLGFPRFLAQRVVKYREKGGKFKKKEDLAKIYGLQPALYDKLAPYILLPEKGAASELSREFKKEEVKSFPTKAANKTTDLNLADTADFKTLTGIGSVLASRIVKYRSKIGGFAKAEQMYEVYGLDSATVGLALKTWSVQDKGLIKRLALNTLPLDSLAKHPYVGRKSAKILVNYRNQHGAFKDKNDLVKTHALEADKLEKLLPYIEF